jgi:hypothetical protein
MDAVGCSGTPRYNSSARLHTKIGRGTAFTSHPQAAQGKSVQKTIIQTVGRPYELAQIYKALLK